MCVCLQTCAQPLTYSVLPACVYLQTGTVHRVMVYPSNYGLERMADEAAHGPQLCTKILDFFSSSVIGAVHRVMVYPSNYGLE